MNPKNPKNDIICLSCRYARMSGGRVMKCLKGFYPELAFRYGKCKRYEPRVKGEQTTK